MYLRAERLVLVAVRVAVLAFVLVSVGSVSSAGGDVPGGPAGDQCVPVARLHLGFEQPVALCDSGDSVSSLIAKIKSASPQTKVLNYKEPMGLADDCGTPVDICRTGITYQQAAAHDSANPGDPWILRDSSGKPIPNRSYAHV